MKIFVNIFSMIPLIIWVILSIQRHRVNGASTDNATAAPPVPTVVSSIPSSTTAGTITCDDVVKKNQSFFCYNLPPTGKFYTSPVFVTNNSNEIAFATKNTIVKIDTSSSSSSSSPKDEVLYDVSNSDSVILAHDSPFGSFCFGKKGTPYSSHLFVADSSGTIVVKKGADESRLSFGSSARCSFVAVNNDYIFTIDANSGFLYAAKISPVLEMSKNSFADMKPGYKASFNLTALTEDDGTKYSIADLHFEKASIAVFDTNQRYVIVAFDRFLVALEMVFSSDEGSTSISLRIPTGWGANPQAFRFTNPITEMTVPFALVDIQMVMADLDSTLYSRNVTSKEPLWNYFHDNRMSFRANPRGAFDPKTNLFFAITCHSQVFAFDVTTTRNTKSGYVWTVENSSFVNMDAPKNIAKATYSAKLAPVALNGNLFVALEDGNIAVLNSDDTGASISAIVTGATVDSPLTSLAVSQEGNFLVFVIADNLVQVKKIDPRSLTAATPVPTIVPSPAPEKVGGNSSVSPAPSTTTTSSETTTPTPSSSSVATTTASPPTDAPSTSTATPPQTPSPDASSSSGSGDATAVPPSPAPPTKKTNSQLPNTPSPDANNNKSTSSPTTTTTTISPILPDTGTTTSSKHSLTFYVFILFFIMLGGFIIQNRQDVPEWIEKATVVYHKIRKMMDDGYHHDDDNNNNDDNKRGGGENTDGTEMYIDDEDEMNEVHEAADDNNQNTIKSSSNKTSASVTIPTSKSENSNKNQQLKDDDGDDESDKKPLVANSVIKKPVKKDSNNVDNQPSSAHTSKKGFGASAVLPRKDSNEKLSSMNNSNNNVKKTTTFAIATATPTTNKSQQAHDEFVTNTEVVAPKKSLVSGGFAAKVAAPLPKRGLPTGASAVLPKTEFMTVMTDTTPVANNNSSSQQPEKKQQNNNNNGSAKPAGGWNWAADDDDWN